MKKGILVFLTSAFSFCLYAQTSTTDIYKEYNSVLQLTGEAEVTSLNYHSWSTDFGGMTEDLGDWEDRSFSRNLFDFGWGALNILPLESFTTWNSEVPYGGNDGALWQGVGFNQVITAGVEFDSEFFSVRLYPEFIACQNSDFDIIDTTSSSGYGDYWTTFDNLQRFGEDPFSYFSWGQSDIRFTYDDYVTLGFSTENIVLGPGKETNILLGDNAEGIPHFDLGTPGAIPVWILGDFDFRLMWGFLEESEYFDEDDSNDWGWISGFYAAYQPIFFKNFTLGINHQYYKPLANWDAWDLVRAIPTLDYSNSSTDDKDMMVALIFEWMYPEVGFEVYAEWARNDRWSDFEDIITEPEHTQGLTFGFSQVLFDKGSDSIVLSGEFANLEQERTTETRSAGPWYRHSWSGWTQGYTNEGQLLGASIGPGSNTQWGRLAWFRKSGMTALTIQRIANDKDYFYHLVDTLGDDLREVEGGYAPYLDIIFGAENMIFLGDFDLYTALTLDYNLHYNFEYNNNFMNVHAEFGVRYNGF